MNIERLGARDLRATKGWSIGVWFIPFLNLIRPKQLMDDIWRASDPALGAGELRGWQKAAVPGLLHGWWAVFLISGFVSNIAARMLADAGLIAAAILAVLVVRAVTSRQESRAARVGSGIPPAAYAVQDIPVLTGAGEPDRPNSFPPPMAAQ